MKTVTLTQQFNSLDKFEGLPCQGITSHQSESFHSLLLENLTIKNVFRRNSLLLILSIVCLICPSLQAGVLYTEEELWAAGDLSKTTQAQWNNEEERYAAALKRIAGLGLSAEETDFKVRQEFTFHKEQCMKLSRQKYDVQAVLIRESNARSSGGKYRAPDPATATKGISADSSAGQGMDHELGTQVSKKALKEMHGTLKDMGLDDTLKLKDGELASDTPRVGGDFDLSLGVNGLEPKVDSPLFNELITSEANSPDSNLSKGMEDKESGTKDLGADYVAVQDTHKMLLGAMKEASKEHTEDTNIAEKMAIGIYKLASYLPQIDPSEITPEEDRKAGHGIGDVNDIVNGDFTKARNQQKLRKQLLDISSGKTPIKTTEDLEKLRKLGDAVFDAAERKTFRDACKKMAAKQAEIKKIAKMQKRLDALKDTPGNKTQKAKLKKSFAAKKAELRKGLAKMKASKNAATSKKSPYARQPSKSGVKQSSSSITAKGKKLATNALDKTGKFLAIADVGNACKKLEDYMEGKGNAGDVVRGVVNLVPGAGSVVNIYDKTKSTGSDFGSAYKSLKEANENNLTAHLSQWEARFCKTGMSQKEARRYVANAVLSGNMDVLESKADELRNQGKKIKSPKLVVEDCIPGPDGGYWYPFVNAKDMGVGIVKGGYEGIAHIVTTPHRLVGALHERELKEADLDYNSKTATSDMKTRLFRKLLYAGIDRRQALAAVNGSESMLREVTGEAQKKMQAVRDEQVIVQAERDEFDQKLRACMREISRLRFAEASIKTTPPSPLKVPEKTDDDGVFPVEVSLFGSFTDRVGEIARMLEALTGTAPKVNYTYSFSLKSAKELTPSSWEVEVPGQPGSYPVKINLMVSITSFPGRYQPIHRTIIRTVKGVIVVKPSVEGIRFTEKEYSLESGYSKQLAVEVTDKQETGSYYYYWTIDGKSYPTENPTTEYTPNFSENECPKTIKASVLLCDKESGCVLDNAVTELTINYPDKPALDVWTVLKKTTEVSVSVEHLYSFHAKLGASPVISYQVKARREVPDLNQLYEEVTDVKIKMSPNGKSINELELEIITYHLGSLDGSEKVARTLDSGARYKLKNIKLVNLKDESSTQPASATYHTNGGLFGTYQGANKKDGQLIWGKVYSCGNVNHRSDVLDIQAHLPPVSVYFSMSQQVAQGKYKKADEQRKEERAKKSQEKKKALSASQGGGVYEGPFATDTPFKATIIINVGKDGRSVSGTFKGEAVNKNGKSKATMTGEFMGSIDQKGRFEAKVSDGTITPWKMTEGKWYPHVLSTKSFPSESKLIGNIQENTISGDMKVGENRGYKWSAKLKK